MRPHMYGEANEKQQAAIQELIEADLYHGHAVSFYLPFIIALS